MTDNEFPVVIAGAGIGGLTAALTLHAAGIDTLVLESAQVIRPLGVGINMLPHAVEVLTELGLGDQLDSIGVATSENVYCDAQGTVLFTEPRGLDGQYRYPQYSLHRGRLQTLLLDTVIERLGTESVRTGCQVQHVAADANGITVGTAGSTVRAATLVGADGVHSAVRADLHPDEDQLRWAGVRMWRGAADVGPFLSGRSMAIGHQGADRELIAYPIGEHTVNWVALARTAPAGPLPADARWNEPVSATEVLEHFSGWDFGWLDIVHMIESTETIVEYPMVDRDPLDSWGSGRITLLGDAAHPMYPLGANGGSQSIVDAAVLARELAADPAGGLAAYEAQRVKATAEIVLANRRMLESWGEASPAALAAVTTDYRVRTRA